MCALGHEVLTMMMGAECSKVNHPHGRAKTKNVSAEHHVHRLSPTLSGGVAGPCGARPQARTPTRPTNGDHRAHLEHHGSNGIRRVCLNEIESSRLPIAAKLRPLRDRTERLSMKIALVTDGIHPFVVGGMQRHSGYLVRYLNELGIDLILVHCAAATRLPSGKALIEALGIQHPERIQVIGLPFPSMGKMPGHYLRESFAYSRSVYDALRDELDDIDLIYAKGLTAWYLLDLKRKGALLPPIGVKFHGYEMFQHIPGIKQKLAASMLRGPVRFNNRYADVVFSYGGKISNLIRSLGVAEDRIIEIPTGISSDWLLRDVGASTEHRRFLFVGRYERRKGIEELTAAIKQLPSAANFEFGFVGPVPYGKRLKDPRITYHGQVTDTAELRKIVDQAEVLVTPSYAEGMPNVIMEGMARGLAIIATDVGAVATMVDERNGWLIEPGEATSLRNALAAAIDTEPDALDRMRRQSIDRVATDFTWSEVAQQTAAAFETIIRAHG